MNFMASLLNRGRLILTVAAILALTGAVMWLTMIRQEDPRLPDYWRRLQAYYRGEGINRSASFAVLNRGKRSCLLDLKQPEDVEKAKGLVKKCDIAIENYAPRVMEGLGLGYNALKDVLKDYAPKDDNNCIDYNAFHLLTPFPSEFVNVYCLQYHSPLNFPKSFVAINNGFLRSLDLSTIMPCPAIPISIRLFHLSIKWIPAFAGMTVFVAICSPSSLSFPRMKFHK